MTWTAWPAAERPLRTLGLALVDLALATLASLIGGDAWWGATALLLLLVSQNRWFLPSVFRADDDGVEAGYPLRRRALRWRDARLVVLDPMGGWMSDRPSGGRRGRGRGLDLYWGPRATSIRHAFARIASRIGSSQETLEIRNPVETEGDAR